MNEQELSYGIFLSESQLDFLYNYPQGYNRMKCFVTFLKLAVKEPTHYVKGKFEVDLTLGNSPFLRWNLPSCLTATVRPLARWLCSSITQDW